MKRQVSNVIRLKQVSVLDASQAQFSGLKTEYSQWKQPVHWKRGVSSEDTGKVQSDQTKHFCHFTPQQNAL